MVQYSGISPVLDSSQKDPRTMKSNRFAVFAASLLCTDEVILINLVEYLYLSVACFSSPNKPACENSCCRNWFRWAATRVQYVADVLLIGRATHGDCSFLNYINLFCSQVCAFSRQNIDFRSGVPKMLCLALRNT